jgi:alginate O-acetyltransferase complex protein AlgI
MFYPQLVAGPIERPQNILWQFRERHYFVYQRVKLGLQLMMWGMFKKVVIADRCAAFANQVYNQPQEYTGISLIIATLFFAIQIYCDFSAYSDIARGSAQVMGYELLLNFDRPYFSKSISEFWKRWHISLSTWFRDYLYIPLGGNRVSPPRRYFNLFLSFLVSGLWHGANWTYVIWGALNGFYLIIEMQWHGILTGFQNRTKNSVARSLTNVFLVIFTFLLTGFAWIFFRANTLADAYYIISHLFTGLHDLPYEIFDPAFVKLNILLSKDKWYFIFALAGIAFLLITHFLQRGGSGRMILNKQPLAVRWTFYFAIVIAISFFGAFNESQQFIYFQF